MWARIVAPSSLLAGCFLFSPSADDINEEFAEYVADANPCKTSDQCVIANAECPLPCFVAVRTDRKADVEAKARELVDDYERGGATCAADCAPPGEPVCSDGRCTVTSPH